MQKIAKNAKISGDAPNDQILPRSKDQNPSQVKKH